MYALFFGVKFFFLGSRISSWYLITNGGDTVTCGSSIYCTSTAVNDDCKVVMVVVAMIVVLIRVLVKFRYSVHLVMSIVVVVVALVVASLIVVVSLIHGVLPLSYIC